MQACPSGDLGGSDSWVCCGQFPCSLLCCLCWSLLGRLQFMTSVATMLRRDLNLPGETDLVQEEMAQVLHLETHLANVRQGRAGRLGLGAVYHTV